MTHNEARGHWLKEGAIGVGVGVLYGVSYVSAAHPFDTIKTKMQAQSGFERLSTAKAFSKTIKSEGIRGLYRGVLPPLLGASIFRSSTIGVFEATYTAAAGSPALTTPIPGTAGLEPRVILGGVFAATTRAVIETPLDYAKIQLQMGETWRLRRVYTGFCVTWARTVGLLSVFFSLLDTQRRNFPGAFSYPLIGPFLVSGISGVLAWWTIWPLEFIKTRVQCQYGGDAKLSTLQRLKMVFNEVGVKGLYRGIGPGSMRAFVGNGTGLVVMTAAQKKITQWGLRDSN